MNYSDQQAHHDSRAAAPAKMTVRQRIEAMPEPQRSLYLSRLSELHAIAATYGISDGPPLSVPAKPAPARSTSSL